MAARCPNCGNPIGDYNLRAGRLCSSCQQERIERITDEKKTRYDVDDLMGILGLEHPESVKRLGRKGTIPGRVPGVRKHLYLKEKVNRWVESGSPVPRRQVREDMVEAKAEEKATVPRAAVQPFVQRWVKELERLSLVQFLWDELGYIVKDAIRHQAIDRHTKELYEQAVTHHIGHLELTHAVPVPLEQDTLYHQLRNKFPASPAWPSYRGWKEQGGSFLTALLGWREGMLGIEKYVAGELGIVEDPSSSERPLLYVKTKLASFCLGCDLLTQGIQELAADLRWAKLLSEIQGVRVAASVLLLRLLDKPPDTGWPTHADMIWADSEDRLCVVESTRMLLAEMAGLRLTQDQLASYLRELEALVSE